MTKLDAALTNWAICFEEGRYTAARSWWAIVHRLVVEGK